MKLINSLKRRDGVALLIVLGLLAALLLTAVSFAIFMRIERNGTANFRHSTSARHIMQTALTRSMADIDTYLGDVHRFPPWRVMTSTNRKPYAVANDHVMARVLSKVAATNVPALLRTDTYRNLANGAEWVPVYDANNLLVGRYGYVVYNVSDMLDVNFAGGVKHGYGTNANELALSGLGITDAKLGDFKTERDKHRHYELLPEFSSLQQARAANTKHFVTYSYFPTNSVAKQLSFDTWNSETIEKPAEREQIIDHIDSSDYGMLTGQGNLGADIADCLIDYLDKDSIPGASALLPNLEMVCVERVPMINEVILDTVNGVRFLPDKIEKQGANYLLVFDISPTIEFMYPFVNTTGGARRFPVRVEAWWKTGASLSPKLEGGVFDGAIDYLAGGNIYIPQLVRITDNDNKASISVPETGGAEDVSVYLAVHVYHDENGSMKDLGDMDEEKRVDAAPFTNNDPSTHPTLFFRFDFRVSAIIDIDRPGDSGVTISEVADNKGRKGSYEAIDPRYNWQVDVVDARKGIQWVRLPAGNSELRRNEITAGFFGKNGRDGDEFMYCSDSEKLISLGEFGALPRGGIGIEAEANLWSPDLLSETYYWRTIRLFDHHDPVANHTFMADNVYAHFKLRPPLTKGLVNVFSTENEILQAAFLGAPKTFEEDPADTLRITGPMAVRLAERLKRRVRVPVPPDPEPAFTNMQQYASFWPAAGASWSWYGATPDNLFAGIDDACPEISREAVFAATRELMSPRQQLFLIIMRADAFAPRFGLADIKNGRTLASTHAMALVWRDPEAQEYRNAAGFKSMLHPMHVQTFRNLDN